MTDYSKFNPVQFDENRNVRSLIAFSVTGTVEITPYGDSSKRTEKTHIVYAIDQNYAERKFIEYYNNKNRDYEINYTVFSVHADETLF